MLILRIRQAEVAADAGRLDEAYELVARDERFRSNRRGQDAITRLVTALVRRGREHLGAGRFPQAGADCDKASKLAGESPDVAQLRLDLRDAQLGQRGQRDAGLALAAARRHVEEGALSIGRNMLADIAGEDSRARRLMTEIDDQRARFETALAAARAAAERRDWASAVQSIARAQEIRPADAGLIDVAEDVARALSQQAQDELNAGRLDRAAQSSRLLRAVDSDSPVVRDISAALDHCGQAWTLLQRGRPHDAAECLRRVAVLFPRTSWIGQALKQVTVVDEALTELRASPLSLVPDTTRREDEAPAEPVADARLGGSLALPKSANAIPERFILQVDGGGAFLVVRSAIAKIGPISSSVFPDVALVAEATAPPVSIERVEDDYFLRAASPVMVNDKPVTGALLNPRDRIGLTPRCRFVFSLPHAASTTAVLDLSGARYPRADVRRVILLDRDLVLGPGPASHVRVAGLASPVVLNLRGGMLRASSEATINGKPIAREDGLPLGAPIVAGGVSFVISRV